MNPFKKSGIRRIIIGEPYSPDTGNWIYVRVEYNIIKRQKCGIEHTVTAEHRFRVQSYEEILPAVLEYSQRVKATISNPIPVEEPA